MSDEQRNTVWRFAMIFILIALGFVAVLVKIIYVQTVERDEWLKVAEKQVPTNRPIKATRGNILDCNGQLLASSMPQYYMYMDTRVPALHENKGQLFVAHIDSLAADLARIVGDKSAGEYKARINRAYLRQEKRFRVCDHRINYLQRQALEQNKLIKKGKYKSGIFFEDQHRRIKPYGILASRTIGAIYGEGGDGISGLEKGFDKELRGIDGMSSIQRIGGRNESVTIEEAKDGLDVVTTIDANLQDIVERVLYAKTAERNAKWGCCILMETQTGAVKAIANLDRSEEGEYYEAQNHAVQRVEPGSTFKTIALVAALDDGKIEIDDTVKVTKQPWQYFTVKHTDAHPMDTVLTVRSALAVSSNIALAKLITRSYEGSAKKFVKRIEKMGLKDSIYCEIPGAEKARVDIPKDTVTLSKMSYGYSVELSPMQILMFYNAIANKGRMVRPMLVSAIQKNGEKVKSFKTETVKSSICSKRTLRDIQGALHDVVWDDHLGTAAKKKWVGAKAQSNLVSIAGKTGTAQLYVRGHGYSGKRHRMTFVGYFPEENPRYTCICMIEDPQYPYDAGMDCGAVVRIIAEKTMAYTGCYVYENGERKLEKR
jgi:cell division protein FtsI (penicillin-binding protein 3)